jgi:hypothetical protein
MNSALLIIAAHHQASDKSAPCEDTASEQILGNFVT